MSELITLRRIGFSGMMFVTAGTYKGVGDGLCRIHSLLPRVNDSWIIVFFIKRDPPAISEIKIASKRKRA